MVWLFAWLFILISCFVCYSRLIKARDGIPRDTPRHFNETNSLAATASDSIPSPRRARDVLFTQKSITNYVDPPPSKSGTQSFRDLIVAVCSNPASVPRPRLVLYQNRWWSLDNHRLWALKLLEEENSHWDSAEYFSLCKVVSSEKEEFKNKLTTTCGGRAIVRKFQDLVQCTCSCQECCECAHNYPDPSEIRGWDRWGNPFGPPCICNRDLHDVWCDKRVPAGCSFESDYLEKLRSR
jgi:hypothetical protein